MGKQVKTSITIDWGDIDMFGHVNNVKYFGYVQTSRVAFWDAIDLLDFYYQKKLGPILKSCNCEFYAPMDYPGSVTSFARVLNIGNTSFTLEHTLLSNQKTAAKAEDVIVFFDFEKQQKLKIPDLLKEKMNLYLLKK